MSKRILIVDDEEQILFALQQSLEILDDAYDVQIAGDGAEALAKARETFFDLVITDLRMPGMDGVKFTQALRSASPDTAVVWMTAYGGARIQAKAEQLEVYRYLEKPLRVSEIRQVAREALETVRRQISATTSPVEAGDALAECLDQLWSDTGSYCTLLITTGGQVIDVAGAVNELDIDTLSVLLAGNFLAAHEIARMLGQESTIKVSYHESDKHNVYAYGVEKDYLLVIVFGHETKAGLVWLYARRAADELAELVANIQVEARAEDLLEADLTDLSRGVDSLFGEMGIQAFPGPGEAAETPPEQVDQGDALGWQTKEPAAPRSPEAFAPGEPADLAVMGETPLAPSGANGNRETYSLEEARRLGLISDELAMLLTMGKGDKGDS